MSETKQAISTTYQGILITYEERDNEWVFELRGRERKVDSLEAAKKAIDVLEREKKAPFERVECFCSRFGDGYKKITVTSLADDRRYGNREAWITDDGSRSKMSVHSLYPCTPANMALIADIAELTKQKEAINGQIKSKESLLVSLEKTLPKD